MDDRYLLTRRSRSQAMETRGLLRELIRLSSKVRRRIRVPVQEPEQLTELQYAFTAHVYNQSFDLTLVAAWVATADNNDWRLLRRRLARRSRIDHPTSSQATLLRRMLMHLPGSVDYDFVGAVPCSSLRSDGDAVRPPAP